MWPLTKPLPEWLEYRREARFGNEHRLFMAPHLAQEVEDFLKLLEVIDRKVPRSQKIRSWILTGRTPLIAKARKGDLWAQSVLEAEATLKARAQANGLRKAPLPENVPAHQPVDAMLIIPPQEVDVVKSVYGTDAPVHSTRDKGGDIRFDHQSGEIVEVSSPAVLVMPVDAVNDPIGLLSPHAEPEFKEKALAITVPEVVARPKFHWGNLRNGVR